MFGQVAQEFPTEVAQCAGDGDAVLDVWVHKIQAKVKREKAKVEKQCQNRVCVKIGQGEILKNGFGEKQSFCRSPLEGVIGLRTLFFLFGYWGKSYLHVFEGILRIAEKT